MKNRTLKALLNNYNEMRLQLREKVHTPKTRRFFQLCQDILGTEKEIHKWIGIAHGMCPTNSIDELTKEMMQIVSNGPFGVKKTEWQALKIEVAGLFEEPDFTAIMEKWEECRQLQQKTFLEAGKIVGQFLYKAFTEPNAEILDAYLQDELEADPF